MLGYVKAYKPSLTVEDYGIYKGIYCSLCRSLGRNYGPFARALLSYDFAFAAVVLLGLSSDSCTLCEGRCPFRPAHKCLYCSRGEIDLCAHGLVITAYYKLRDDLADRVLSKKIAALLLLPFVSLMHRRAVKRAPEAERIISEGMLAQAKAEKENGGIDACAHPSADTLGRLFRAFAPEGTGEEIYRFGYMLGRLIYIMDAADDFDRDLRSGDFNPLRSEFGGADSPKVREEIAARVQTLLNQTHAALISAYEALPLKRFEDITGNIIYDGQAVTIDLLADRYKNNTDNRRKKKKKTVTVQ